MEIVVGTFLREAGKHCAGLPSIVVSLPITGHRTGIQRHTSLHCRRHKLVGTPVDLIRAHVLHGIIQVFKNEVNAFFMTVSGHIQLRHIVGHWLRFLHYRHAAIPFTSA